MTALFASPVLVWRQIHLQRPVDPEACLGLLRRLASDERSPLVVFEARANAGVITYLVGTPATSLAEVIAALKGLVPGTTLTPLIEQRAPSLTARQVKASTRHRPLRMDDLTLSTRALLGALSAAGRDEHLVLQVVLGPRRIPLAVPTQSPSSAVAPWYEVAWHGNGQTIDSEKRTALRAKVADHGFACAVRVGVVAGSPDRRKTLLLGLLAALRTTEAAGVQLRHTPMNPGHVQTARRPLLRWPLRLNAGEVLALLAWPLGDSDLPGQPALHPQRLPPAPGTTERGRVVALSTSPGCDAALSVSASNALHHTHVIGPTGVGKSVLLGRLIEQDIADGRGVVVIEPKGDLVDDVLAHIPQSRRGDIVVLDPSDPAPVGLNPLALSGRRPELVADAVLSVFKALYADSWGPRTQDILHACLLTLAKRKDASLVMLPLLLTNAGFRRSLTQTVTDPIALQPFWEWYESLSEGERNAAIAPVMNKLRPWLLNSSLRAVLGQREPAFTVRDVFTQRRVLLVPLRSGVIGKEAAMLLGSLVVATLWQTVQSRTAVDPAKRHPVMVYIDEVQDYLHLPTDLGDALAQARGLGVGFTLAHQFLGQLTPAMRAAVLSNARSRVCFQLSHEDAVVMSKGHPELGSDDFTALGQYEIYASLRPPQVGECPVREQGVFRVSSYRKSDKMCGRVWGWIKGRWRGCRSRVGCACRSATALLPADRLRSL
ncbi:MAG: type IV secretion system DNA-binding domain-containing protein [Tetrasphaera sp.]